MNISPLGDIVVIKRCSNEEISGSGLYIPASADFLEDVGIVRFCGKGKKTPKGIIPMEVKPGDKVYFSTNGHMVKVVNGEELIVTRQDSIIGVINA